MKRRRRRRGGGKRETSNVLAPFILELSLPEHAQRSLPGHDVTTHVTVTQPRLLVSSSPQKERNCSFLKQISPLAFR